MCVCTENENIDSIFTIHIICYPKIYILSPPGNLKELFICLFKLTNGNVQTPELGFVCERD